jgi:hypothetical protein
MATKIYDSSYIELTDGTELHISPLKIKYLREFMQAFSNVKTAKNDMDAIGYLSECAAICMKQYYPSVKTVEDLEDVVDLPTIYKILDVAAGIRINEDSEEDVKSQATEGGSTWEELDLAKLESEVFLLGIWKDYEELETSLSMPELIATLGAKRDLDYEEKKFLAAIQGVDLDKQSGQQDAWEKMKAKVFSGGTTDNPNDIVSYQGNKAAKAGFGIGMGLDYEKV